MTYKTTKTLWRRRYRLPRANITPKWLRNAPGKRCLVFGTILPPGGRLLFDAAEPDDGGAEVLAESLIFAAPNGAFFEAKLSTIGRSKSQPKKLGARLAFGGVRRFSYKSYRSHKSYPHCTPKRCPLTDGRAASALISTWKSRQKMAKVSPFTMTA